MLKRLLAVILTTVSVGAQAAYPEQPIQLVVPYSPGGIADIMARKVAEDLSKSLKTSVVVMNKGGANAIIGTQYVARARPDGYTILFTPNTPLTINPLIRKNMPYDAARDLDVLSVLVETPIVVLARPELKLKSLNDLAALARTKKGGLNYSAVSAPGPLTLPMNKMQTALKFDMTAVPYPGAGQAMNALLAGDVDVGLNALGPAVPLIQAGKLTPVAVGTATRMKELPDVQTIEESLPDFKTSMWYSFSVPTGVPENARTTLLEALKGLRDSASLLELFERNYLTVPAWRSPQELKTFVADDMQRWEKIIKDSGIEPN
ncbi:ABC transporter substrate-binding protein [Advenella kashmirensis W13003]|uniref:ABC transporter substrate-binding protein n=1 Tax=Advenella kashmirensis W13003 TaxID=1424334 RepID=V8QWZ8_9BURK|nr:tripartite tricarboxylate transporter substrate binding protein [Advenella kashmirensis]ETF04456.1 ABC transporter substrate-binding protein [Advenella kashmirensis W13003]